MNKRIFSAPAAAAALAAGLALSAAPAVADSVSTKGGITVKSEDGRFVGTFGGRFMLDTAVFDNDLAENQSGTEFRRLRFASKGKIYDAKYKIEIDFSDDEIQLTDAYLSFDVLGGALKIGQFRPFFLLEELTSSNHISLMERASLTELGPGRQIGVGYWRKLGIFGAGISGYNTDSNDNDEDEGVGGSLRLVAGPKFGEFVQAHFGVAAVSEGGSQSRTRVRVRPAGHLSDASRATLLDINNGLRVKSTRIGLETAVIAGPLSLQAEVVDGTYEDDIEEADVKAWYMTGSFFVTGESRNYKVGEGSFGRIKPKRDFGAIELVARMEYIENDTLELEVETQTVGVNWYFNPQMRAMLNYVSSDVVEGLDEPSAFTARFQFDF